MAGRYDLQMVPDPSSPTGFSPQYVYTPATPLDRAREQIGQIGQLVGQLARRGSPIVEGIRSIPARPTLSEALAQPIYDRPSNVPEVTAGQRTARRTLSERFEQNRQDALQRGIAAALQRSVDAPGFDPATERGRREAYDLLSANDPFYAASDPRLAALATGAGQLVGAMQDPTSFISPGRTILGRAVGGAGVGGATDVIAQALDIGSGVVDQYNPLQTAGATVAPALLSLGGDALARAGRGVPEATAPEPIAPEPLAPVQPRRRGPSVFDYAAYEATHPLPRPFETAPNLPPPRTYEEAVDQVQSLQAQLNEAYRDVGRSTSVQNPGVSGMRSLDRRAVLERQLAAARTELERLRPPAPERQNAPGTSEAARAYLERLGMGRVAELGSTRPPERQPMRRGQRPPGDIRAQTQALLNAGDEQAASILRGLRDQGFAFEQEAGPIVYGGTPGTPSFTVTREYTPTDTPRIFWHGSSKQFDEFANRPTWFTEDQDFAQQFGDAKPYLLRLTNEYKPTPEESRILSQDPWIAPDPSARQRLLDRLSREGYDHVNNNFYDAQRQTSYSETILLNPSRENVIPADTFLQSPAFRVGERRAPGTWPSRQRPRAPEPLAPVKAEQTPPRVVQQAQRAGYAGQAPGEAVEYLAAAAKGLPMDQASRMQRARKMGFDTDFILYHGTGFDFPAFDIARGGRLTDAPSARKAIWLSTNPDASDLYAVRQMSDVLEEGGFNRPDLLDRLYKREITQDQFDEIMRAESVLGRAEAARKNMKQVAANATNDFEEDFGFLTTANPRVRKIVLGRNPETEAGAWFDANKAAFAERAAKENPAAAAGFYQPEVRQAFIDAVVAERRAITFQQRHAFTEALGAGEGPYAPNTFQGGAQIIPAYVRLRNPKIVDQEGEFYRETSFNDLIDQAIAEGHDGLIVRNTYDPFAMDAVAVFDPKNIRSVHAAFDPDAADSSNLLAGIGALAAPTAGLGAAGAMAAGAMQEPERRID